MPARRSAIALPESRLLLRRFPRPQGHQPELPRSPGDGPDRPLRLREVDAASHLQPHLLALSRAARRGRDHPRRTQHPVFGHRRQRVARPRRHGLPEADAVSDVDLRQHRLRREALRAPAAGGGRHPRRGGLAQGGALGRGQGQAAPVRHGALRRPAAAPVHRAHGGPAPRGDPLRRADLGARSDLDRAHRGTDRAAARRVHDRHRHAQHAAGRPHLAVHRLHVSRRARRIRRDLEDLHESGKKQTQDYITGRFG